MDEFVATCKERDIDLVFYTAPAAGEYKYGDFLTQYAEKNGCYYVNLFEKMEEAGIDPLTDFSDMSHLNHAGATKVADYLGEFLIENGIMPE